MTNKALEEARSMLPCEENRDLICQQWRTHDEIHVRTCPAHYVEQIALIIEERDALAVELSAVKAALVKYGVYDEKDPEDASNLAGIVERQAEIAEERDAKQVDLVRCQRDRAALAAALARRIPPIAVSTADTEAMKLLDTHMPGWRTR